MGTESSPSLGVPFPVSPHRLIRGAAEMSQAPSQPQVGRAEQVRDSWKVWVNRVKVSTSREPSGVCMGWVGPPTVERRGWWVLGWQSPVTWWSEWTSSGCLGEPPTLCSLSELLRASLGAAGAHWYPWQRRRKKNEGFQSALGQQPSPAVSAFFL